MGRMNKASRRKSKLGSANAYFTSFLQEALRIKIKTERGEALLGRGDQAVIAI
jgi:hypothetical protein